VSRKISIEVLAVAGLSSIAVYLLVLRQLKLLPEDAAEHVRRIISSVFPQKNGLLSDAPVPRQQ
jgi:hypothetical protein